MTTRSGKNPYRPGVGIRPLYLAGRDAPIRRFVAMLRAAPEQPANMRITGLRGVGKTVLLTEFGEAAEKQDWEPAQIELQPAHNTDVALTDTLTALTRSVRERISRTERVRAAAGKAARKAGALKIDWGDVSVSLDPGSASRGTENVSKTLYDLVELAVKKGRNGVVLLLDEAQVIRDDRARDGEHPLSMLISAVSILQRSELPLGLVVCGLPTLTSNLLRARSYTERMFRAEEVDSLGRGEARVAFMEPLSGTTVSAGDEVVDEVTEEVEGYPYFVQLWGAELWDAAVQAETTALTVRLLEATRAEIYRRLDLEFYDPRIATLTPAEQDVLLATAGCPYPPLVVSDLNAAVDKTPGNINVLLGRLVEQGVLYRIRKGQYEYTAPKFRDYLERRA